MTSRTRFARTAAVVAVTAISAFGLAACSSNDGGSSSDSSPVEITYMHRLPDGDGMTPVK